MAQMYPFMFLLSILMFSSIVSCGGDCLHDIQIQQWRSGSTAENVPIYTVQMVNEGSKGVEQIMVDCGDFRSSIFINPSIFRRVGPRNTTCIVNGRSPIAPGKLIRFRYSNDHSFSFSLSSYNC